MDLLLVLDETAGRGRSRRRVYGARKDRSWSVWPVDTGRDDPRSSAFRGLVYGLPTGLLLWAAIVLAVWATWLR